MILCPPRIICTVILPDESGILSLLMPGPTENVLEELPHLRTTTAGAVVNVTAHIVSCFRSVFISWALVQESAHEAVAPAG
jgi:hypothetical protein